MLRIRFSLSGLLLLGVAALINQPVVGQTMQPAKAAQTDKGMVLIDSKGMSLYTYDEDTPGKSNCNGDCAKGWPPLVAPAGAKATGDWSIVTRADGSKMWAYKGQPLYGWFKDKKPGDTTGDDVEKVWHLARP